jgi:hypothetical protein
MPDWETCAAFLAGPDALGAEPEVIETHTARVHLTETEAWKLRRPVDYGWLDYATREKRRLAAEREIAWNAAGAPGLYRGLGGVADGPRLLPPQDDLPPEAEPLVVMHRFRTEDLFDRLAGAGRLDRALMQETGVRVAAMHRAAPERDRPQPLLSLARSEASELREGAALIGEAAGRLAGAVEAEAEARAGLAGTRPMRRCHGDLHLRNLVLWRGAPAAFDCIDFTEAENFVWIDPLYDLAFLLMDLSHRGLAALRPAVLSAWAEEMAAGPGARVDLAYGGLGLLPLHEALRAGIRAKIAGLAAASAEGETCAAKAAEGAEYAALGLRLLAERPRPRVIAVGGRSGTGKTTLARGLAEHAGAVVLRSDRLRKGLAGVAETDRLPPESYTPESARAVYDAMQARARMILAGGHPVILDAAHLEAGERAGAARLAEEAGVPFDGIWLEGDPDILAARIRARERDASDATPAVLERQLGRDVGPLDWAVVDAAGPPEDALAAALAALDPAPRTP